MPRVAVGIAVHAEPARFRATLESVRRTVSPAVHLVAVAGRPDAAAAAALAEARLDVLAADGPGGAEAFNRLLGGTDAEVCVLLESGCLAAPGWLDHLLAALAAHPRNGLAGPSTNRAWNEQGADPACTGSASAISAAARRAAMRHGAAPRTLEPLFSLADFCYAVRRRVWDDVGAADEAYGAGPCWEMDYNARAARAGWRGVWAPAAFVWRAPFTARRALDERRLFDRNRRLYQDRLCALKLRGERAGYEPHCRGDACEHFAPPALVRLRIDPPRAPIAVSADEDREIDGDAQRAIEVAAEREIAADVDREIEIDAKREVEIDGKREIAVVEREIESDAKPAIEVAVGREIEIDVKREITIAEVRRTASAEDPPSPVSPRDDDRGRTPSPEPKIIPTAAVVPPRSGSGDRRMERPQPPRVAPARVETVAKGGEPPLISCIMPTRGRPELAMRAVRYFLAQDHPRRELIVLDDEGGELGALLPPDPRIRYEPTRAGETIGEKRNRGVELARGEIVAQWDDDDWYAPSRLSAQAAPILDGRADVTGLRGEIFFDLERWEFWTCSDALHRRLFVHDVHGGTLMFRRSVWGGRVRYPRASLAEDAAFLVQAVRAGARLRRVDTPGLFVYLRHGANAWTFACGRHMDPRGWRRMPEPPHLAPDRDFYVARSLASRPPAAPPPAAPRPAPAVVARTGDGPLVSCLMPTADRRAFVPRAIEHFLRQTYAARELVIVDDGADAVADLVPDDPRIRYVRAERSASLGGKRNLACSLARGPLLAHWDDDDWMADGRLAAQVDALERAGADVCGLATVRFFDPARRRAWEYRWAERGRGWVSGNTLLYRRAAWERRPFPALNEGEDTRWVWSLPSVHAMRDPSWFAALVHPRNTSRKQTRGQHWHPLSLDVVKAAMGDDWRFYEALAAPARELVAG